MKIGFPNNPSKDIMREIPWVAKHGFGYMDIFLEEGPCAPGNIAPKALTKELKKNGLEILTGHMDWRLPLGSQIRELRQYAVEDATGYLDVFSKIGVRTVTIHSDWQTFMACEDEAIKLQARSLRKLAKYANEKGIRIAFEPTDTPRDSAKNIEQIFEKVPQLCMTLDIGHANLQRRKPHTFIKRFHRKIIHVHAHDNDGLQDQHQAIGSGTIDWEKTIGMLKKYYDGTITLEIFRPGKRAALKSKKALEALWHASP